MRILLIILLFIPSLCFPQGMVNLNKSGVSIHRDSIGWAKSMARTYKNINRHMTVGRAAEDTIAARMAEDYVTDTYGPLGLDKKKADFFLYFATTQDSSFLTTRTITNSSDSAIMWDFGDTTYYQNNLPAHVAHHGAISATSYDDFDEVTVFDLRTNSFSGGLFNVAKYMPNLVDLYVGTNNFTGTTPSLPATLVKLYMEDNDFYNLPDISDMTGLSWFHAYRNNNMTGIIDTIPNQVTFREYQVFETKVSGVDLYDFSEDLLSFRIHENRIDSASIQETLDHMATYYTTTEPDNNLTMDISGAFNEYVEDTATNTSYQTLDDVWKAAVKTLTFAGNPHPGRLSNGAIVLTFDGCANNIATVGGPLFDSLGAVGVIYMVTGWDTVPYGDTIMSWDQARGLEAQGWEVANHSHTHPNYRDITAEALHDQLRKSDSVFVSRGWDPAPPHFAYPFGGHDAESKDSVMNYYLSARLVEDSYFVGTSSDPYLWPTIMLEDQRQEDLPDIYEFIDFAAKHKVGAIFLTHSIRHSYGDIEDLNSYEYTLLSPIMRQMIEYTQSKGVDILTADGLYNKTGN